VSQLKLLFRVPKNVQGAELSMDATKDVMIDKAKSSTSCADAPPTLSAPTESTNSWTYSSRL
jgi:hypothetical protein